MDIKLDRKKTFWKKTGIMAAGIFLLFIVLDWISGGRICEWFFGLFVYRYGGEVNGVYTEYERIDWELLKVFMAVGSVLAAGVFVMAVAVETRSAKERTVKEIEELIRKIRDSGEQDMEIPPEYAAVCRLYAALKKEREERERMLNAQARQKNDLITYLAHDLKTPLASVIGYLSLLEETHDLPEEKRRKYTGIAYEKAERLEMLVNEFFDIIRFNFQEIFLTKQETDLNYMLAQLADEFYPIASGQGKTIERSGRLPEPVNVDADKLARVFQNVLKNALAYGREKSTVRITAEQRDGKNRIVFENEGDPIPEEKQKVIFEKFYRLDSSRSSRTGGAGLGLAVAKEIVHAHGGSICVKSSEETTRFIIELP